MTSHHQQEQQAAQDSLGHQRQLSASSTSSYPDQSQAPYHLPPPHGAQPYYAQQYQPQPPHPLQAAGLGHPPPLQLQAKQEPDEHKLHPGHRLSYGSISASMGQATAPAAPPPPLQHRYDPSIPQQPMQQAHMHLLQSFWMNQLHEIENVPQDFKVHHLPLARIKKVMKTDDDVKAKMISAEAPIIFDKGCDIFITELTLRAWIHAEENKRRTLQRSDIAAAVAKSDMFDFLIDIVPREEYKLSSAKEKSSHYAQQHHHHPAQPQQQQQPPQQQPGGLVMGYGPGPGQAPGSSQGAGPAPGDQGPGTSGASVSSLGYPHPGMMRPHGGGGAVHPGAQLGDMGLTHGAQGTAHPMEAYPQYSYGILDGGTFQMGGPGGPMDAYQQQQQQFQMQQYMRAQQQGMVVPPPPPPSSQHPESVSGSTGEPW